MTGFRIISLRDMLMEYKTVENGEGKIKNILSVFSCERNKDIESFLKLKAIEFDRQALSRTYLVFASYREKWVLAGYFTIAQKTLTVFKKGLTSDLRRRIKKFSTLSRDASSYQVTASLIAQLGLNDNYKDAKLLSGGELLSFALKKVKAIQDLAGGKIVYLECEDQPGLIDFYQRHGFCIFGKRPKDPDEIELVPGRYLIQMLRYLDN